MFTKTMLGLLLGLTACTVATSPASTDHPATSNPGVADSPSGSGASGTGTSGTGTSGASGAAGQTVSEAANNDDFATAQIVKPGDTVNARWEKPNDVDYFAITIPAGTLDGYLQVTVSETDPKATPMSVLYKSDHSRVENAYAKDATTNPFVYRKNVTAGKEYYVALSDLSGSADAIIPYSVKFEFLPVEDKFERNDDFASAKPALLGTPFDLVLFSGIESNESNDIDVFTVDVPSNKTKLHLELSNNSTAEEAQLHVVQLFDANKGHRDSAYAPNSRANVVHDFNVTGGERVYLQFEDIGRQASATASKVTITFL